MHPTQLEILDSLRHSNTRKFSELLKDTAETSDNLTYHLKRLIGKQLIESPKKGEYHLATNGVKYLNNNLELQHDVFPTISSMLELHDKDGRILIMEKLKQPFLGSLHLPTFGLTSRKSFIEQLADFFDTYKIFVHDVNFKFNYHERLYGSTEDILFDKLFLVYTGTLTKFTRSVNDRKFITMPKNEILLEPRTLPASRAVLEMNAQKLITEATRHL